MQIPQSHTPIKLEKINSNLKEFLKKHFKFPSQNIYEINDYIKKDDELCRIIYELPRIISKEFKESPIMLDFMKYTNSNESILQISIKTPYDGKTSSNKQDIILEELYKYKSPEQYYFITMMF